MHFNPDDIQHMRHALALARRGLGQTAPNPSVGCVIVKNGKVIAQGSTADGGRPHAESIALSRSGRGARGATAYVTLEPCAHHGQTPPCAQALIDAGISRCVIACGDPDPRVSGRGIEMLKAAGIEVVQGVCAKDALKLNAGFFLKVTQNRPLVTLKIATSLNEKIAAAGKKQISITSNESRRHVHALRTRHDAILTGIGTVISDDPRLNVRLDGVSHNLIRIVLDTNLRIPPDARILNPAEGPVWIFHRHDPVGKLQILKDKGVELFCMDQMEIEPILNALAARDITRLMVEAGQGIVTSFVHSGFVDAINWYCAPHDIGSDGLDAIVGVGIEDLAQKTGLKMTDEYGIGSDTLKVFERS